jgi:hypothetical protein
MASVDWEAFTQAIQLSLDKEKPNDSALFIIEGHLIFNYKSDEIYVSNFHQNTCNSIFDTQTDIRSLPKEIFHHS